MKQNAGLVIRDSWFVVRERFTIRRQSPSSFRLSPSAFRLHPSSFILHPSRRGFTLLELLVVLVIVSVVMAVVLPNMRGPGDAEAVRTSARELASAAQMARQEAVAAGETSHLRLDLESQRFRIVLPPRHDDKGRVIDDDRNPPRIEAWRPLARFVTFSRFLRKGIVLEPTSSEDEMEITFNAAGSSDGLTIELTSRRGQLSTVEISASTGRASMWKGGAKSIEERLAEEAAAAQQASATDPDFHRIGQNETERVASYKSVLGRLVADQQRQFAIENGDDPATYFAEQEADDEGDMP